MESPGLGEQLGLDLPVLETTPLSGYGFQKTPTRTGIGPFSMILERVATSSKCKLPKPHKQRGGCRSGSALETSPFSGETFPSSRKQGGLPAFQMDSMVELPGTKNLSPKPLA